MSASESNKPAISKRITMERLLQNTKDALAKSPKSSSPSIDSVILPVIRKVMPNIIANDILSVQPMTANMTNPFTKKWERVGIDVPTDKWVYNIRSQEIRTWVEEQPAHMWKFYDIDNHNRDLPTSVFVGGNYVFTEEMEAWFQLRWS